MDINVSETKLNEYGLTKYESLLLKSLQEHNNLSHTLEMLQKKDLITGFIDDNITMCSITSYGSAIAEDVITSIKPKSKSKDNDKRLEEIAKAMIGVYPEGFKMTQNVNGTWVRGIKWTSSLETIKERLSNFERDFGVELDLESAIKATKIYVDVETKKDPEHRTTMRVLKYFIYKNRESDFLEYLEIGEQEENYAYELDESNGMTIL